MNTYLYKYTKIKYLCLIFLCFQLNGAEQKEEEFDSINFCNQNYPDLKLGFDILGEPFNEDLIPCCQKNGTKNVNFDEFIQEKVNSQTNPDKIDLDLIIKDAQDHVIANLHKKLTQASAYVIVGQSKIYVYSTIRFNTKYLNYALQSQFVKNKMRSQGELKQNVELNEKNIKDFCKIYTFLELLASYEKNEFDKDILYCLGFKIIDINWCNNFDKDKESVLSRFIISGWDQILNMHSVYQPFHYQVYSKFLSLVVEEGMTLHEDEKKNYFKLIKFYTYGDIDHHIVPYEVLDVLGSLGVDLNIERIVNKAFICADRKMIKILLDHGLDSNYRNRNGESLLALSATYNCDVTIIKQLITLGADINEDASSLTPLFTMVHNRQIDIDDLIAALQEVGISQNTRIKELGVSLSDVSRYRNIAKYNSCCALAFGCFAQTKNYFC